uniref:Mitochondrial import receptor subunit TOM70 n=1 Tax=Panagrellus redivivus TaxID=6233 RepID=A0A7E5A0I6_PANRE
MPEGTKLSPLVKGAAIVGGTALVGTAAYFAYKHFSDGSSSGSGSKNSVPKSPAERLKEAGNELFKKKKYDEALENFRQAANLCDEKETTLKSVCNQNAAACLEKLELYPECILACTTAIEINPRYTKAIVRRAQVHAKLNEDEEAMRDFTLITLIEPGSKVLDKYLPELEHIHKRLCEKEMQEITQQRLSGIDFPIPETAVLEWLKYSVVADPIVNAVATHVPSEEETGIKKIYTLIKLRKYDDVASATIALYEEAEGAEKLPAAVLAARFFTFHNNLKKVNDWVAKFWEDYEALPIEEKEQYLPYAISVYNIQAASARTLEESEVFVIKAEDMCPTNTDPRFGFAANAILHRQLGRANQALDVVLAKNPEHPYARFYRTHFEFTQACEDQHMGRIHNHILEMERLLNNHSRAPIFTYTVLSNIHANSNNYPLAIEILDKGLQVYPDLSEFIMLKTLTRAKSAPQANNLEHMTSVFIELCKRDPNNFEAQATYAKICAGNKDYDKAFECFERAIQLARQPQELQLALSEYILSRANREAQYLLDTLLAENVDATSS